MKMKKFLALLLCLCMMFSLCAMALAEDVDGTAEPVVESADPAEEPVVEDPTEEPVVEEPVEDPAEDPVEDPVEEPAEDPVEDPVEEPVEDPTEEVTAEEPLDTSAYEAMTGQELYETLNAMEDQDAAKQIFGALSDTQKDEYYAYRDSLTDGENTDSPVGVVDFTNVAPIQKTENTAATEVKQQTRSLLKSIASAAQSLFSAKSATDDALQLTKSVSEPDEKGVYTLTLEAYATGTVTVTPDTYTPCDIVLVLDQSGSMADPFGDTYKTVTGGSYYYSSNQYFGFSSYKSTYYILLEDDTYQAVYYAGDDDANFDYYRYRDGGSNTYVYPKLADGTTTASRQNNYQVVQFYSHTTRLDALKSAVTTFVNSVEANALGADGLTGTDDDIDHRIAIVGFGSDNSDNLDVEYENTELLSTSSVVGYNGAKNSDYSAALVSVNDNGSLNSQLSTAIGRLAAQGGTAIDLGTEMANKVLEQHKNDGGNRAKVVVIFTDGVPGIFTDASDSTRTAYANRAIGNTNIAKKSSTDSGYGATVYTVGIFSGADGSTPGTLTTSTDWDSSAVANKFMHLLSSNYPSATSMSTPGTMATLNSKSYYLSASDTTSLNSIFSAIAGQINGSTSVNLDATSYVKDIISPYFTLPTGTTTSNIKVYTADCTGKDSDGKYAFSNNDLYINGTVTIDGDGNVSVTGFSFKDNYVAETGRNESDPTSTENCTFYGRKLVIKIPITVRDGFWGGDEVITNGADSGVYSADSTAAGKFTSPTVNVPLITPTIAATDANVYYGGAVPAAASLFTATTAPDPNSDDAWKDDYASVSVTCSPDTVSNTADSNVTGTVTITSNSYASNTKSANATATVNVYTPTATWHDSTIYLGDTPDYATENFVSAGWMHGNTASTAVAMSGLAPTVTYSYSPTAAAFTDCTAVTPTIAITNTGYSLAATAFTVHVLKPTITWGDSICYYGATFPTSFTPTGEVAWSCGDYDETTKPAPTLTYTFSYALGNDNGLMPNSDVPVNVTAISANGIAYTDAMLAAVTFVNGENSHAANVAGSEFKVTPLTCSLTIKKSGATVGAKEGFIFSVKGSNSNAYCSAVDLTVTVKENGSIKIAGLPIGNYTVTEDTGWSWRYSTTPTITGNVSVELDSSNPNGSVTVTNSLTNYKWLAGDAYVKNKYDSASN